MEQAKFTRQQKNEVSRDWLNCIPELSKYKTNILVNRIGPLLVGVSFKYNGFQTRYVPIYSVHNLAREFNSISCTLIIEAKSVKIENYKESYKEKVEILKEHAYIPMKGDLELESIISGYKKFFLNTKRLDIITECEDLVLICGWCKSEEKVKYCLDLIKDKLKNFDEGFFREEGGFENWYNDLRERALDGDKLREICEEQIKILKLEKISTRKLIY